MPVTSQPYLFADFPYERKLAQRQPVGLTIRQTEYNHDVAWLQYDDELHIHGTAGNRQYNKGTPIVIQWGWSPKTLETFTGYVYSSRLVSKKGSRVRVEVLVTGADFSMNTTRLRTFQNVFVGQVVYQIAREHRFTSRIDFDPKQYAFLPQLGRSDWRLMSDLAKEIGYTFSCKRTELQFRRREISGSRSLHEFRYSQGIGPDRGSLFAFKVKAGSDPLSNTRTLVIGGVDDSGKPFWATDSKEDCCGSGEIPNFTAYYQTPTTTMQSGQSTLKGLLGQSKFRVQADVVTSGDPRVRCGSTVRFTNAEPGVRGRWWVGQVEHRLTGTNPGRPMKYRMDMKIGRETVEDTVCVTEPPRPSFSGKPVVFDPCELPEPAAVPTVYAPVDACAPLETPARPCRCPPKKCPGRRPDPNLRAPRFDGWAASYTLGRR